MARASYVHNMKFGKGYVSEVVSESKVEITFADARRILVHNRKDIDAPALVDSGAFKLLARAG